MNRTPVYAILKNLSIAAKKETNLWKKSGGEKLLPTHSDVIILYAMKRDYEISLINLYATAATRKSCPKFYLREENSHLQ